jgi:hypothetical protein
VHQYVLGFKSVNFEFKVNQYIMQSECISATNLIIINLPVKSKQNGCHELWQILQLTVGASPVSKWLTAAAAASNCTTGAPIVARISSLKFVNNWCQWCQ